jgi:hypothetical protein
MFKQCSNKINIYKQKDIWVHMVQRYYRWATKKDEVSKICGALEYMKVNTSLMNGQEKLENKKRNNSATQ